MIQRFNAPAAVLLGLGTLMTTLAGCANDGTLGTSNLTTSAVTPVAAAAPKVDPVCVTLAAQIDQLRQEGSIDRLQQASQGKTTSVQVKRASLAKQAELNRVNAEFQTKCATIAPKGATAAAAEPAKAAVQTAAAATTAKTAVKKVASVKPAMAPIAAAAPLPAAAPVVTTTSRAPDVVVSTIPPKE